MAPVHANDCAATMLCVAAFARDESSCDVKSRIFNMMRNLGGAIGIAMSAAVINDQTNLHFQHIAARLTPANGAMERLLQGSAVRYAALPGSPQHSA